MSLGHRSSAFFHLLISEPSKHNPSVHEVHNTVALSTQGSRFSLLPVIPLSSQGSGVDRPKTGRLDYNHPMMTTSLTRRGNFPQIIPRNVPQMPGIRPWRCPLRASCLRVLIRELGGHTGNIFVYTDRFWTKDWSAERLRDPACPRSHPSWSRAAKLCSPAWAGCS